MGITSSDRHVDVRSVVPRIAHARCRREQTGKALWDFIAAAVLVTNVSLLSTVSQSLQMCQLLEDAHYCNKPQLILITRVHK